MTVLLEVRGLYKTFGGVTATKNVSLDVIEGEVHAIIGPNGAGKTTLISQLCGEQFPDAGKVHFNGRDITKASGPARAKMGIARSFQITTVFQDMTLLENVALAAQAHDGHSFRFWRNANSEPEINRQAMERLKEVAVA